MNIPGELRVLDSRLEPAGSCIVCGHLVGAGEGLTAIYAGQILRFKCAECFERFAGEPEAFLGRHVGCCRTSAAACSPASEWTCY